LSKIESFHNTKCQAQPHCYENINPTQSNPIDETLQ
jgi:hypothetical protein